MPAFMIHMVTAPILSTEQAAEMKTALRRIEEIVNSYGGFYHSRLGTFTLLDGASSADRLSLIEFPSIDALKAFYRSEEYQPYVESRQATENDTLIAFESSRP